jgi:N-acylglucosamine 2-epimerase
MHRRDLLIAGGAAAGAHLFPSVGLHAAEPAGSPERRPPMPGMLAGMTLERLRDDYRDRLFRQYLPFWEKDGIDRRYGGFMCELNDDGSVAADEKYIWYQGRGIWVYSFLYNEFGQDRRWLEIARQARDFMVKQMYAGDGKWIEKVHRDGAPMEKGGENVFGILFAALGLAEYHRAAGQKEDAELAKKSVLAALEAYDNPNYTDTHTVLYAGLDIDPRGLRSQGHSMVVVGVLGGLLTHYADPQLEDLCKRHVDLIVEKFWNPEFRITNEFLRHDYGRAAGTEAHMLTGHALETLWLVMADAQRRKDQKLFELLAKRVRHLLEMCWDYVFDGFGDGNFYVHAGKNHSRGPDYDIKTMWAQCEAMIACLMVLEDSAAAWAAEWYERVRAYALKVMPVARHGVWRQAVDRFGKDVQRAGISANRKDNYHQARMLMLNLLSLDRMLKNPPEPRV